MLQSSSGSATFSPTLIEHIQRYLPLDMAEDLHAPALSGKHMLAAFAHLAAARYTITTYLPRLLVHRLLHARVESPWLHWVEGSLLFADLSGSTALAERLSSLGREGTELVTDALNDVFTRMIHVVQDHGGDLITFGGDALLVFFGDDRHPRTATRAALALQAALHDYSRAVPGIGTFPMHLHIGVESGPVAFVSAGLPHAQHYSALGATVNAVAVAEGRAAPGEVVVGPQTWARIAAFAGGEEVAPGFVRVGTMRPPLIPHPPLADILPPVTDPQRDIPHLLHDLDLLSPYIPPVLRERILADPQRPRIEADLRPVTVLFAQAVGLEDLAERLTPDEAAQAVQAWLTTAQHAVEQFGGVVNKLDVADEGIKLVAIFGAPIAYEDHTERAARAALRIENEELRIEHDLHNAQFSIRQRIGLNVGTAFAGNVGSVTRKEYTVMGDAVNVAARVMGKAAWGEVWCSEAAAAAIGDTIRCEARGAMALKGKTHPLALFLVAGEREPSTDEQPADGPMVGRADELAWLNDHLRAAQNGQGRAVRVVGEAGVGKSRLMAELVHTAQAANVQVIRATCLSYTASIPYAAWGEWLKARCDIQSTDDDAVRARKLADRLRELGSDVDEWLPLFGDLARLDVPENRLTRGLNPQMRQARRFELLEQLLWRAADDGPLLVIFEDLHWADPISLDMWRRVAANIGTHPLLIVGVQRPSLVLDDNAHLLELPELSVDDSVTMARALAGTNLPDGVMQQIVARAGGNPLFLAELLRAVQPTNDDRQRMTDDQLADSAASSVVGRPSSVVNLDQLPDSLNGLLLSRIDQLDETSRNVLRIASVIGQRIPFGVLRSIQATDQQTLVRQLARLDAQQMTALERVEPERVHTFRHALIQEVAYQSMLYARRRELHARIGEYLERRYGDDPDDYYGLLAHHYRLSDRRDKAVFYLFKAGHAARNVYANEEAEQYYGWAVQALDGDEADPQMWEARDALGDVYATVGRYGEALAHHAAILHAPNVTPDAARRAHRKRGSILEKQGQYPAAMEELERAMAIAQSGVGGLSPFAIPVICADIGLVHQRRGEYDQAIAACEEGLRALRYDDRTTEDEQIEARLHSTLGSIYGMRGDYGRARQHFERSMELREQIDDLSGVIISHNNLGYLWQLQSAYEQALEHYRVAEELARKITMRLALMFASGNAAYALISLGRYDDAELRCREALSLATELNAQHDIAQTHTTLGVIFHHKGAYEAALVSYKKSLDLNTALGSTYQQGNTLLNVALTLTAQGRLMEATTAAQQALDIATALDSARLKAEALHALAEALYQRGEIASAGAYVEQSLPLCQQIASKFDQGVAMRLKGQIAAASSAAFTLYFEESVALFVAINNQFELGRTCAAYGVALISTSNFTRGEAYLKRAHDAFVCVGAHGELQQLALLERGV